MKKAHKIVINVYFQSRNKGLLYEGPSFYNKKVVDTLLIAGNRIQLSCQRSKKYTDDFLFSPQSPARIQLYRALCYYLSVTGQIPRVKCVTVTADNIEYPTDTERLTVHWTGCRIPYKLDKRTAENCFGEDWKYCYTAITYFLKAQLDSVSNDCFRAAWSGLNSLYNNMSSKRQEREKLEALAGYIRDVEMPNAEAFLKDLDPSFWNQMEWHNYIQNEIRKDKEKGLENFLKKVLSNYYPAPVVYKHIAEYLLSKRKDEKKKNEVDDGNELFYQKIAIQLSKVEEKEDVREQLIFLITQYCYTIRNKNFHGERPYPLFKLENEASVNEEKVLTQLLLRAINDLLSNYDYLISCVYKVK